MDDTHPLVAAEFRKRLMKLSGETRMVMASRMFDACREIVMASLPKGLTSAEIKVNIFLRFYGNDFDRKQRDAIVNYLKLR